MKEIIVIMFVIFVLPSCSSNLSSKINVEYKDEKIDLNLNLNKRNFSKNTYFGNLKIVNFTNKKMLLSSGTGFCLKSNKKSYQVLFDYGYVGNQISSDFMNTVNPKQTFEHKILINVDDGFNEKKLEIFAWKEDLFEGDNVIKDLSAYLKGCGN